MQQPDNEKKETPKEEKKESTTPKEKKTTTGKPPTAQESKPQEEESDHPTEPANDKFEQLLNFITKEDETMLNASPFVFPRIHPSHQRKILETLITVPHLRSMTFRPGDQYEEITEEQVEKLCDAIRDNQVIKHITINTRLTVESLNFLSSSIQEGKMNVDTLNLPNNQIGPKAVDALLPLLEKKVKNEASDEDGETKTKKPRLRSLDLSGNGLSVESIEQLCTVLADNTSLRTLHIGKNEIGDEGFTHVAKLLCRNDRLESIDISYLEGTPSPDRPHSKAIEQIAEALKINLSLTHLDISHTNLGDEGWKALSDSLKINKTLHSLNLAACFCGGDNAQVFQKALQDNKSLVSLNLSMNSLGRKGGFSIVEALKFNATLESLNICYNNIEDDCFLALVSVLNNYNHTLNALNFDKGKKKVPDSSLDNTCSPSTTEKLRAALRGNSVPDFGRLGISLVDSNQPLPTLSTYPTTTNFVPNFSTAFPVRAQGNDASQGNANDPVPPNMSEPRYPQYHDHGVVVASGQDNFSWNVFFADCGIPSNFAAVYESYFLAHHIEKEQLADLTFEILKSIGVTLIGHQMKIMKYRHMH